MLRLRLPFAVLAILYCAAIFYSSAQPDPPKPKFIFPGADKVVHTILYAGLAAALALSIDRRDGQPHKGLLFAAPWLLATLYGLSDEVHQIFVPQRTFELLDLAADTLGALAMQVFLCGFLWRGTPGKKPAPVAQDG